MCFVLSHQSTFLHLQADGTFYCGVLPLYIVSDYTLGYGFLRICTDFSIEERNASCYRTTCKADKHYLMFIK
jgi:hypothetical protein